MAFFSVEHQIFYSVKFFTTFIAEKVFTARLVAKHAVDLIRTVGEVVAWLE